MIGIYLPTDNMDYAMNQTYLISEVGHWGLNKNFTKSKPIAIKETVAEGKEFCNESSIQKIIINVYYCRRMGTD